MNVFGQLHTALLGLHTFTFHRLSDKKGTSFMSATQPNELAAFCNTCPSAKDVSEALAALGFTLTFQMDKQVFPAYALTPPIPAQWHFREEHDGTEVIYLEGKDSAVDGERLPLHAARFWVFPGASPAATLAVTQMLAARWQLSCQRSSPTHKRADVA